LKGFCRKSNVLGVALYLTIISSKVEESKKISSPATVQPLMGSVRID